MPPEKTALSAKESGSISIAYTYNEPTIFFEYMEDTAIAGKKIGIKSVVITAGYISEKPLAQLCQNVDAIKVDLKAFTENYYRDVVNGELKPVLKSLEIIRKHDIWTEIVYLVVPTLNDGEKELAELSKWVKRNLGPDVPLHFTRFHPSYLIKNLPPTPIKTLERAWEIARAEGLHYVYIGNVPGHQAENTICPECSETVVSRSGFFIRDMKINKGRCVNCSHEIAGKWGR
jgi:pyruvate formate lyase activating enzyme